MNRVSLAFNVAGFVIDGMVIVFTPRWFLAVYLVLWHVAYLLCRAEKWAAQRQLARERVLWRNGFGRSDGR